VIEQAAGLALLAALSPTALLVAAVYLGSARPRLTALFYLAGAVIMSAVMAVAVLVVLRTTGLQRPGQHTTRYGLRLALGLVFLGAGLVVWARHRRHRPTPADKRPGLVSRMIANPSPVSAFLVGILVFSPGVTFLAALQVIATARADIELTSVAVAVVVVINVLLVWLPLVLFLLAPGLTRRRLAEFNGWLRAHGTAIVIGVLVVAGAIMVVNGIYGLARHG
jgi:Sap, sulfolipid-1-addressing protein